MKFCDRISFISSTIENKNIPFWPTLSASIRFFQSKFDLKDNFDNNNKKIECLHVAKLSHCIKTLVIFKNHLGGQILHRPS